jgi:hypothetical protein
MTEDIRVGMGATAIYPQDRYPHVITKISASGKTLTLEPLHTVSRATGHEPDRFSGDFPVWDHTYTAEELEALRYSDEERKSYEESHAHLGGGLAFTIRLTDAGWRRGGKRGTPFHVGEARYLRDYSY